jgi:hypothetical protein
MNSTAILWEPLGPFSIATSPDGKELWAKLSFFHEGFRNYARAQKARWNGGERAWRFAAKSKARVVEDLNALSQAIEQSVADKAARQQEAQSRALSQMARQPFSFDGPRLSIHYDPQELCLWAAYPYGSPWGQELYRAGARFDRERKSHRVPLAAWDVLMNSTQEERGKHEIFLSLNQPWLEREEIDPLTAPKPSQAGMLGLKARAHPQIRQYEIELPFGLQSELGWKARDLLAKEGCFEAFGQVQAGRLLRCEMRHRDQASQALSTLAVFCEALGPKFKSCVPFSRLAGSSWNRRDAPEAGDLFFEKQQAWMISGSRKQRESLILDLHRVLHEDARLMVASRPGSVKRWCALSGVDVDQLPALLDGIEFFEVSEQASIRPASTGRARRI